MGIMGKPFILMYDEKITDYIRPNVLTRVHFQSYNGDITSLYQVTFFGRNSVCYEYDREKKKHVQDQQPNLTPDYSSLFSFVQKNNL